MERYKQPDPWTFLRRYYTTVTDSDGVQYNRVIYAKSAEAAKNYAEAFFANTEPLYKKIKSVVAMEA